MTPRLTPSSYAVLALLDLKPWTGYELTQQAQRSLRYAWPKSERLLYSEPKKLVDMFMEMMKHQRVSVGLPANGRTSEDSGPRNASMEVLMQDIAAKAGEKGRQTEEDDNLIDNLLENPAMLEQLQELIIQTSKKGQ